MHMLFVLEHVPLCIGHILFVKRTNSVLQVLPMGAHKLMAPFLTITNICTAIIFDQYGMVDLAKTAVDVLLNENLHNYTTDTL